MLTRRLWTAALSASAALLLSLVVSELYLRRHVPPATGSAIRADPVLGWDSDPSIEALDNTGRPGVVYFIGDSFTQDRQWPAVAQREAARLGDAFDSYTLGVSGFGTTQEWLKVERDFDRYRPRVVVLQFFAWNDFRDNWPYPAIAYSPSAFRRPYLVPEADHYRLVPAAQSTGVRRWVASTELWRRVLFRATLRFDDQMARTALNRLTEWRLPLSVHYTEPSTWEPFYLEDGNSAYVREAVGSTLEAFRRLHAFLTMRHARLIVIGLDNPFTVDEEVARAWIRPGVRFDPDAPLRHLADALATAGITFINARPALLDLRRRLGHQVYDPPADNLSGHLQAAGDEVLGLVAARALENLP